MSVRFNASGEFLRRTANLPSITSFTVMGWWYLVSDRNTFSSFFTVGNAAGGNAYYCQTDSNGTTLTVYNGSGTATGTNLAAATWYHIALVVDGTGANNCRVYLNGVQDISTNGNGSNAAGDIYIGDYGSTLEWPDARVAFVKVYDAALTAEEILQEMNARRPQRFTNLNIWSPTWPGSGEREKDYSGNGRNWTTGGTLSDEDDPPVSWGGLPIFFPLAAAAGGTTYNQSASGTLTSAGALTRQAGKLSAGALSTAGALSRSTAHGLAGTLTTAGALSAVKTALLSLVGALSPAGALSRQGQKGASGALSGAGALNRAVSRALSGTLSSAATLAAVKTALVSLTGTLGSSGALGRQVGKSLSAALAGAGAVGRAISHVVGGVLSAVGALTSSGGTPTTTTTVILPDAYLYDSAGATGSISGATIIAGPSQSSPTGAVSGATLPGGPTQGSPTGPISGATVQPSETIYD